MHRLGAALADGGRQPKGKSVVSQVNFHANATRIGRHLWVIHLKFARQVRLWRMVDGKLLGTVSFDNTSCEIQLYFLVRASRASHTRDYDPFVKSQLVSVDQL